MMNKSFKAKCLENSKDEIEITRLGDKIGIGVSLSFEEPGLAYEDEEFVICLSVEKVEELYSFLGEFLNKGGEEDEQ